MRQLIALSAVAAVLMSAAGCFAGEETREDVEAAASSGAGLQVSAGIRSADKTACRANMISLGTSMEIYYASYGGYPEVLEDLRNVGGTSFECPGCDIPYRLDVSEDGRGYSLSCPDVPSHGCVTDGDADWN
jgi:hypothetical protein